MEQTSGSNHKKSRSGVPVWLFLVVCGIILILLAVIVIELLRFDIIHCGPSQTPASQTVAETAAVTAQ